MKVQEYLNNWGNTEEALEQLSADFGIKYNIYEDHNGKQVVLNYDQIKSPKLASKTKECRSLVLEFGTWEVISRSFDRFFNYGEAGVCRNPQFSSDEWKAYEKLDGSLIGIYSYKGTVYTRTRSMINPDTVINPFKSELTWLDAICDALGDTETYHDIAEYTAQGITFICELTCKENRVVVKYENETPQLSLLAARYNTGEYIDMRHVDLGFKLPREYSFDDIEECLATAKELRNLEEGFVMYRHGVPCMKVKNPAYVAAHHLRGEGLNERKVMDLILINEVSEYLAIFPEDVKVFEPYQAAYKAVVGSLEVLEDVCHSWTNTQKEFALKFKDHKASGCLFSMKRGISAKDAFNGLTRNKQYSLILDMKRG